jgi:hypothetical protein
MCDKEDCDFCHEKSFASHEKSQYWNYDKNELTPRQVYIKSIEKYFFMCNKCNHSFDTTPRLVVNGHFCPYCANHKMCGDYKCQTCFNKSFATHPFAVNWSIKNDALSWEVFRGSMTKKYYFDCKNCGHEMYVVLGGLDENTLNCLYCSSKKICHFYRQKLNDYNNFIFYIIISFNVLILFFSNYNLFLSVKYFVLYFIYLL